MPVARAAENDLLFAFWDGEEAGLLGFENIDESTHHSVIESIFC